MNTNKVTIYKVRTTRKFPKSVPTGPVKLFLNKGGLTTFDHSLEFEDVMTGKTGRLPSSMKHSDFVPVAHA